MVTVRACLESLASWRSVVAAAIAAPLALSTVALAPAEWFLAVHSIRIVETQDGSIAVIQARSIWPGDSLSVNWTAQIDRLETDVDGEVIGRTVCGGYGVNIIRDDDFEIIRMPLADWVDDPTCSPEPGIPHVAHASWTFRVLGFTKTATQRSAAFVTPYANVALDG
jgi:hypothetical protein